MKFIWVVFSIFIFVFISCGTTKKAVTPTRPPLEIKKEIPPEEISKEDLSPIESNTAPARQGYFRMIDEAILADVENGSPESLTRAITQIRSIQRGEQPESANVLLAVSSAIMQFVWQERVNWQVPNVPADTPYTGAISSVRQGIYDLSTGNVDFLATLLPSLVIPASRSVSEFFTEAEAALKKCVEQKPDSVVALYLLGLLYQKNGDFSRALSFLERAVAGDAENHAVLYSQALCLERTGKYDAAAAISDALLAKNKTDVNVLKLCTQIAFSQKKWDKAEEYVGRVLQQEPNDREHVLLRIRILMEKGDYVRASSLLDVYSRQDATSRDYLLLRTRLQYSWSRSANAAQATIQQALTRYPNDMEVLLFAAEIAASNGSTIAGQSAADLAQKVLKAQPNNNAAREYVVRGFIQNENWQAAYSEIQRLRAVDSQNVQYQLLHVTVCLALNQNDEAWNLAQEMYRKNSTNKEVVRAYISVLVQTGRATQALSLINENIDTTDADFRSFLFYRRSFLRKTQDEQLSDLRSSLIANPRYNDALFRLYQIYYEQREYRRAQYYLRQVVALNPDNAYYRRLNEELNKLAN